MGKDDQSADAGRQATPQRDAADDLLNKAHHLGQTDRGKAAFDPAGATVADPNRDKRTAEQAAHDAKSGPSQPDPELHTRELLNEEARDLAKDLSRGHSRGGRGLSR